MWMKFFNLQSWQYFRRKNFYQIFDKKFFSEIHLRGQISIKKDVNDCEVNTKEEINENLKTYEWKENRVTSE